MSYLLTLVFGLFISVAYGMNWSTTHYDQNTSIQAEIKVNYFLSYRNALIDYFTFNTSILNGSVPDSLLTWPHSAPKDASWSNLVADGKLYVYSVEPATPGFVDMARKKVPHNFFLGEKMASGHLRTFSGEVVLFSLPSQIPEGAIVFVGD